MWLCIQRDVHNNQRIKYVTSVNWDDIIKYINQFENVKKLNDYKYISYDLEFDIRLCDNLDILRR